MKLKKRFLFTFRHFQSRLLFYIVGLLLLTLGGVFGIVNQVFRENTEESIRHELVVTERIFVRLLQERALQLSQQATALASDFAFKRVMATFDNATILSALTNLGKRIGADAGFLVAIDGTVMVDSLHSQKSGEVSFASELIQIAQEKGQATQLHVINQVPYQLIVVPVLAPEPIAWLCLGFALDDQTLAQLKQLTQAEISLLSSQESGYWLFASTQEHQSQALPDYDIAQDGFFWRKDGDTFLSRLVVLDDKSRLFALIERPWQKALENFHQLQWLLSMIALVSTALVSLAATWLARTVSKPVHVLAQGVQAIGRGDFSFQVSIKSHDELGKLGVAFNEMGTQLQEKEKIRNLLGKVVSPAVANELMNHDVVLGGETREITALFTDLTGFTSIAENMNAQELVSLLNDYLTHMSSEISHNAGVLDKFIGDAIVAFWGAPVFDERHAHRAIECALAMQTALQALRGKWQAQGLPLLKMRIGINTGQAVVGNVGSTDRLDYTMIGDTVNLAARLESANKHYGSEILISQFTYERVKEQFVCRELDSVRVQGKLQSVTIYEVIGKNNALSLKQTQLCADFATALQLFRANELTQAKQRFEQLVQTYHDGASQLYLQRLETLSTNALISQDVVYDLSK